MEFLKYNYSTHNPERYLQKHWLTSKIYVHGNSLLGGLLNS